MRSRCARWLPLAGMIFLVLLSPVYAAKPVTITSARGGMALQPVVVSPAASPRVKQAAQSLADYLGKMSGAPFTVIAGDGTAGLAVGRPEDFPALKLTTLFNPADLNGREDYLLRSHGKGIYLLGATEMAVEYAVWDLLYRLGYRQYFPGPTWEIMPKEPSLALAVDAREHPDFVARRIWF